jgi:hypothetical protein
MNMGKFVPAKEYDGHMYAKFRALDICAFL